MKEQITPAAAGIRNRTSYMNRSGRFSVALHVLLHLAETPDEPVTSEHLAACVRTNPVVIRRTLSGLRNAGLVSSTPGHGGGWTLARSPSAITLRDVHTALADGSLLSIDIGAGHEGCRVQKGVTEALDDFVIEAEALLAERLGRIHLADLIARIHPTRNNQ
jgi:Rrf2 family protein